MPESDLDAGEEQWARKRPCPHAVYMRKPTSELCFLFPLYQLCPFNSPTERNLQGGGSEEKSSPWCADAPHSMFPSGDYSFENPLSCQF